MGYSYTPHSADEKARSFFQKRGKRLFIATFVVLLIGAFYMTGSVVTTYATHNKQLELQLNDTHNELGEVKGQKDLCTAALENANTNLNELNTSLNSCSSNMFSYKLSAEGCYKENEKLSNETKTLVKSLDSCRNDQTASSDNYNRLARSSAKPICCSFGDFQAGTSRIWGITNNTIVCSGNYTVNCTTGETNF